MSESFEAVLGKVNYGKYVDEIQEELKRIQDEIGPGKKTTDLEWVEERIQAIVRRQSGEIAREVGLSGSPVMVFMTATSILATAWVSFALRREASDLSKSPEDRLATIEMLDALNNALGAVIRAASSYADRYPNVVAGGGTPEPAQGTNA